MKVHIHFKFVHMHANALQPQILNAELQVDMMDCSLPVHYLTQHRWIQWVRQRSHCCVYSTPIGLLNARGRLHPEQKERVDVGAKEIEICDKLGQAHSPSLLHDWGNRPWHTVSYNCQHHYKNEILNRNSYEKKIVQDISTTKFFVSFNNCSWLSFSSFTKLHRWTTCTDEQHDTLD